jgi:hypothetical protein
VTHPDAENSPADDTNSDAELNASGTLGPAGRKAAIAAALELVGRYLATGSHGLEPAAALEWRERADEDDLSALLATLRLRVALAASEALGGLLRRISQRPTFRYQQRSIDSIGELSGQLDVNRYVANMGTYSESLSFPVLNVYRSESTPENTLAVYAAQWLIRELRAAVRVSGAPTAGPEYRAWTIADRNLRRQLNSLEFTSCRAEVSAITRRNLQRNLVAAVHQRLRRGDIANPTPYAELVAWVERVLNHEPIVEPGDVEWAMYGEWFDSKLFELWCLHQLGAQLASALNVPTPEVNSDWRSGQPVYRFDGFYGSLEVHFQRKLGANAPYKALWSHSDGTPLLGTPDILVLATPTAGSAKAVLLDPKLKQRRAVPYDDVYKMLGYLQNFPINPPAGFVLSHTISTEQSATVLYRDGDAGVLGTVKLNPIAPQPVTAYALRPVIEEILRILDRHSLPLPPTVNSRDSTADSAESYSTEVAEWLLGWGKTHQAEIAAVANRIQAAIGAQRWKAIDEDAQIMIATADFIGYNLSGGDFSGPVIGLCAAIEHTLHTHLIDPALDSAPTSKQISWRNEVKTFGAAIAALEAATGTSTAPFHSHLRGYLIAAGKDHAEIANLVPAWRELNKKFRIPAAHRQLVTQQSWQAVYGLVVGAGTLLANTIDTLIT